MNLKSFAIRSLIALVFGPAIILSALAGGYYWLTFVVLVVMLSVYEFYRLSELKGAQGQMYWGLFITVFLVVSFYFVGDRHLLPILLSFFLIMQFEELYRRKGSPTLNLATTAYAPLFYALGFGSFVLIREYPSLYGLDPTPAGGWIVLLILSTWMCDTAAYVGGSYLGKHKLMPRISPNKTVEGTVIGFLFALLTAYLCHIWFIKGLRWMDSLFIGAVAGSIGQYGDLFESMIKRDVNVKDSSRLIPEHGGILDRFDSLTVSAPVVYLYLKYLAF